MSNCSRTSKTSDPWLVLKLIRLEKELNIPIKGLLPAIVCWETGFNNNSRGDWRNGYPRSYGPFQMMKWWDNWCNFSDGYKSRDRVYSAGKCYVNRIYYYLDKYKDCKNPWIVAEAMAANGFKYKSYGCSAKSKHIEELNRWRYHE